MTFVQRLDDLEQEIETLNTVVETQARAVAAFRGTPLDYNPGTRYSRPLYFEKYERSTFDRESGNTQYYGVDYPMSYRLGTKMLDVTFYAYVGDQTEQMFVSFPECYLDVEDWQSSEQIQVDNKAEADNARRLLSETEHRERAEREFERLKKELGK